MNNEREFDWDDEIVEESSFTLLEEGEYEFIVDKFTRGLYEPKHAESKIPACKKACLELKIIHNGSTVVLKKDLLLHSKMEWMLSQFFISIGQKKQGEPLKMNWNEVPGARGLVKIGIREYTTKNGDKGQSNDIISFLPPRKTFTAGAF